MSYLVYLKRASTTIQVDPATAPSNVQLFLFSSRAGWRSWRRRWSWRWFRIVTFWRFRCSAVSASNTGVHQPESHFSILSSRTFVVTKEVATCIDPTSLLTLASLLNQIQLVLVAIITFFAAVKHLQCRVLISVSFAKKTAFSLVKSRFAIRQPDCFFLGICLSTKKWPNTQTNGRDHFHGRNPFSDHHEAITVPYWYICICKSQGKSNYWSSHSFA